MGRCGRRGAVTGVGAVEGAQSAGGQVKSHSRRVGGAECGGGDGVEAFGEPGGVGVRRSATVRRRRGGSRPAGKPRRGGSARRAAWNRCGRWCRRTKTPTPHPAGGLRSGPPPSAAGCGNRTTAGDWPTGRSGHSRRGRRSAPRGSGQGGGDGVVGGGTNTLDRHTSCDRHVSDEMTCGLRRRPPPPLQIRHGRNRVVHYSRHRCSSARQSTRPGVCEGLPCSTATGAVGPISSTSARSTAQRPRALLSCSF